MARHGAQQPRARQAAPRSTLSAAAPVSSDERAHKASSAHALTQQHAAPIWKSGRSNSSAGDNLAYAPRSIRIVVAPAQATFAAVAEQRRARALPQHKPKLFETRNSEKIRSPTTASCVGSRPSTSAQRECRNGSLPARHTPAPRTYEQQQRCNGA